MNQRRWLDIAFHIICCISFLLLPFLLAPDAEWKTWVQSPPGKRDLVSGILLVGFFYLNYYKLVPLFYFKGKKWLYFLIASGCFTVISFMSSALTGRYRHSTEYHPVEDRKPFRPAAPENGYPGPPPATFHGIFEPGPQVFLFLIVFLLSMGLATHDRWRMEEKERIKTELHFLKAQINPHFLFNAMNGIYSLTLEKSDQAPKAVLMLSSMMRYLYGRDRQDLVPLKEELEYIDNYINLQKLRFIGDLKVEYEVHGDAEGKKISPMILMPLVENAFKHGVNPEASSEIGISIVISANQIELRVVNNKVPVQNHLESASGIGIANTRNRLALQYPGMHRFNVTDDPDRFSADLTIQWIS